MFLSLDVVIRLAGYEQAGEVRFDAIILFPELTVQQPDSWGAILDYANRHQIPILTNSPLQVEAGALLGYLSDNVEVEQQVARLADQILTGQAPG